MSINSAADRRGLEGAGVVVRLTLDALAASVRPGVTTGELDAIAAAVFSAHGARSAPALVYGFPGTVLISINDEVVHGVPGLRRIARGDVVKLDVTVELAGYMADAARTVVVEGSTEQARTLARCAERAFAAALDVATAGRKVREIGRAVERVVRDEGFTVIRGLTGHGIGRTIHEPPSVPNHFDPWQQDVLTEGLVLTIEPIICAGRDAVTEDDDGWTVRTRDGSLAAHHEHTLIITTGRPVLLTAA
ncbi:MAG TPA: type I methionyl aminopeptidase [Vicinamibacterales bacterium]|nr:type I methionyl aminopeptidase [Vicinamibacterales bacterium]